jgi:CRISPR-associated endonuclease Cas1 subtype I-F
VTDRGKAAMRELAKAGVLVGFCGGGGTPLFSSTEFEVEIAWLSPQSEYRPTEYLQHWGRVWFRGGLGGAGGVGGPVGACRRGGCGPHDPAH